MNKILKKYLIAVNTFILYGKYKNIKLIVKKLGLSMYNIINILNKLKKDFDYFKESDPSIKIKEEVLILNSFKAICYYRLANLIYENGDCLAARLVSEIAHSKYGIDIHPGARIDSPFFIDHGTGVVIGETAIIEKNVKIYHGVTLGAKEITKEKRHPTIKENVIIYCHSGIFGNIEIEKNSIIKAYSIVK